MPFNAILSGLGISKCVCTCVTYFPRIMFVPEMKAVSWVYLRRGLSFLDYFFIFLFFRLKTKYFCITKSRIARDPAPICDPTKQLGWLYFWEKFYSITRNLPAFSDIYTIIKSFISRFERNALWLHFYLVFIDFIGLSKDLAVLNCKVLKEKSPYASSGVYWIDPDGSSRSNALQVYCDQQMDGGGRTLVYSYTFTAYSNLTGARHILMRWSDWCELPTTPHVKIQLFFPLKKITQQL